MQVLSGINIDDGVALDTLSHDDLVQRATQRKTLRLGFPGLAAINFEMLLHILTEEVVGWDMKRHSSTKKAGLFGVCYAFAMAIEEQGRKTLHAHMTLWIKGYKELKRNMLFGHRDLRPKAKKTIEDYYDHIATTALFDCHSDGHVQVLQKSFM